MIRLAEFIGMAVLAIIFARGMLTYFSKPTPTGADKPEKENEKSE